MYSHTIKERVKSPKVRCPIRVTQSPLEREQPLRNNLNLTHRNKRSKGRRNRRQDYHAQFDDIHQLGPPRGTETIRPQEVKEVCWRNVEEDVLEAEERGEQESGEQWSRRGFQE
jgi:hypothetical protein